MKVAQPIPISDIIKKIPGGGADEPGRIYKEEILRLWKDIAGEKAAAHSRPVQIKKDTIVVNVDSPVWLYQLNLKKTKIEKGLGGALGRSSVKIKLRAGEE